MLAPALIMGNGAGLGARRADERRDDRRDGQHRPSVALFVLPTLYLRFAPGRLAAPLEFADGDEHEVDLTNWSGTSRIARGDVVSVGAAPTNGESATRRGGRPRRRTDEGDGRHVGRITATEGSNMNRTSQLRRYAVVAVVVGAVATGLLEDRGRGRGHE